MKVFVAGATGAVGGGSCRGWSSAATGRRHHAERAEQGAMLREPGGRSRSSLTDSTPPTSRARRRAAAGRDRPSRATAMAGARPAPLRPQFARPTGCAPRAPATSWPRRAPSAPKLVAQSYTGWPNARTRRPVKTEDDPLDPTRRERRESLAAIRALEAVVTSAAGIAGTVLRYGALYGPGTRVARANRRDGPHAEVPAGRRRRRVWSFIHVEDAARGHRRGRARHARASTTSSTTSRRRSATGCRTWPSRRRHAAASASVCRPPVVGEAAI